MLTESSMPRELTTSEVKAIVAMYRTAAENAKKPVLTVSSCMPPTVI